jgi:hypothetical protein
MEMFRHDPAGRDDQGEFQFGAQFSKRVDEVASQSRTKTKQAKPETKTKSRDISNEL